MEAGEFINFVLLTVAVAEKNIKQPFFVIF